MSGIGQWQFVMEFRDSMEMATLIEKSGFYFRLGQLKLPHLDKAFNQHNN